MVAASLITLHKPSQIMDKIYQLPFMINIIISKATVNDARYKVSRNSRNKSRLPLLFVLCLSGIIQCKHLLLKVQCLDNNRWRYVTSATIYELKEKIISNITSLYYKVHGFKIMCNSYSQLFKICSTNTFYAFFPFSQRK